MVKNILGTVFLVTVFLSSNLGADVCTYAPPKPRTHVCGVVVAYQGRPIPEVRVVVSHEGNEIAAVPTTDSGEFDFRSLPDGRYNILFENRGFKRFQFGVTVNKADETCTRQLGVKLTVGAPLHDCEEVRVVKKGK